MKCKELAEFFVVWVAAVFMFLLIKKLIPNESLLYPSMEPLRLNALPQSDQTLCHISVPDTLVMIFRYGAYGVWNGGRPEQRISQPLTIVLGKEQACHRVDQRINSRLGPTISLRLDRLVAEKHKEPLDACPVNLNKSVMLTSS